MSLSVNFTYDINQFVSIFNVVFNISIQSVRLPIAPRNKIKISLKIIFYFYAMHVPQKEIYSMSIGYKTKTPAKYKSEIY